MLNQVIEKVGVCYFNMIDLKNGSDWNHKSR